MKNAIIIGGLSGIGKGIATAFTERGFNIFIGDIKADISNKSNNIRFLDAVRDDSIKEFVTYVNTKIQHLDALIITIGVIDEGSIINIPLDKWGWIFNNNLFSYIKLVDAFLPMLEKSKESKILLTGSGSGFGKIEVNSGLGLYAISKHALLGYFRVLHDELLEKNIQVSLLIPSAIAGNLAENSAKMRQKVFKENSLNVTGKQPEGRLLDEADVAARSFISEFLDGKKIISNKPSQLIDKCQNELDDLIKDLY